MSDIAIRVEHLSKQYRIGVREHSNDTLGGMMADWVRQPWRNWRRLQRLNAPAQVEDESDLLWALKDVSFDVKQGEVVGIIGRNGAGKSTLLKIISKITKPTQGRVLLHGRIASLLEVGTGFHPDLTGRENVYLNGTILGMTKSEIDRKFDEIVDFAGIEKFIDTPVKRYSSGMQVRLAFSVAAHLEPEILLVDEVLAVGDIDFQRKCLGKMESVAKHGRTVLFVSHNMNSVQHLCSQGILLNKGMVEIAGDVEACIAQYLNETDRRTGTILKHGYPSTSFFTVDSVTINDSSSDELYLDPDLRELRIVVTGCVHRSIRVALEVRLHDASGTVIGTFTPGHFVTPIQKLPVGNVTIEGIMKLPVLTHGEFYLNIVLIDPSVAELWTFPYGVRLQVESIPTNSNGMVLQSRLGHGAIIIDGTLNYS